MKLKLLYTLFFIALLGTVGWGPFTFFLPVNKEAPSSQAWVDKEASIIQSQAKDIDPKVLRKSLVAFQKARRQGLVDKDILTIIDYSRASKERRLWVVDLSKGKVLFNTWVSHGKNSGNSTATSFSNQPGSLKSSPGVFVTEKPYIGNNGYSLRLIGLERGINHNAYKRAIVMHGAWYVNQDVIKKYGQLGRSWGCPAVSEKLAKPLINTIKERTLVFVYSDDRKWLNNSSYLAG